MKKTVFRLSLCTLVLGLVYVDSQIVSADTTKEIPENRGTFNVQSTNTTDTTTNTRSRDEVSISKIESTNENVVSSSLGNPDSSEKESARITEHSTNELLIPFSETEASITTAPATLVSSGSGLKKALKNGASSITLTQSFEVNNIQLDYYSDVTINGDGNTLTFKNGSYFHSEVNANDNVEIAFNNLTINSDVSSTGTPGANQLINATNNVNLTLTDFNYTASQGCPLVATTQSGTGVTVNFSGTNKLTTSGSGAKDTTLFLNITNINVKGGETTISDTTPNGSSGSNQSVIEFWSPDSVQTHQLNIANGASLNITSSKNILFDLNNQLTMNVGENANFTYRSTGGKNYITGETGAIAESPFVINAEKGSKTLFETDDNPATFRFSSFDDNWNVKINSDSPDFVEFKSTNPNKSAIAYNSSGNNQKIGFYNKGDSTGTAGNYVLEELPTGTGATATSTVAPVNKSVQLTKGKSFQDVIYHKSTPTLTATSDVGANSSTITSTLGGAYTNYTNAELLAVPTEITDVSDANMATKITSVKNDITHKSGYYESGTIASGGKLTDLTNVWAGTYYLYAKLASASASSDWLQATVTVAPLMRLRGTDPIEFVGGYKLSLKQATTVTSEGNVDTTLTYSGMKENSESSQKVELVETPTADSQQLRLNMTVKNGNNLANWNPMLISTTTFQDSITLSPYWVESTNNAVFSVNGNYSGPLGENELVKVSYKVYMKVSSSN